ncbi:MAG: carbohydrate porin [Bacteroidetes bacterium]|nr:carbohydrate porin [Bacteroidota bacterium]
MNRSAMIFGIVLFFQVIAQGQQFSSKNDGTAEEMFDTTNNELFTHEVSYIGDFVSNLHGGRQTGTAYLGMANIKIGFDTKRIGLWKNGKIFINGASTHGATPTEKLFGDFQVASNIEAGNNIYIQELWYKHSLENIDITIGLQDLNSEYVACDNAGSFLNSSFGIPSVISENVPVPIFPLTALGISGRLEINNSLAIQAAIFDGLPEDFEDNPYNLNWDIKNDDGVLIISELQLYTELNDLTGSIKVGSYYHSHLRLQNENSEIAETIFHKNYGFYLLLNQELWQGSDNEKICLFTQIAASPGSINRHSIFWGGGMHYSGLFSKDGSDEFGLAFAHARFREGIVSHETTIEMYYKLPVTENLFLQPDVQYIINPASSDEALNNAFAAIIRFGINF